jgi:type III pantothenate kinase
MGALAGTGRRAVLLAADVGNTEIVLGVFEGRELRQTWRLSTRAEQTSDELALELSGLLEHRNLDLRRDLTGLCVASVVPDLTTAFREMTGRYLSFAPVIVGPGTKTGVPVLTDNPREVGADRVMNALAAFTRYGGPAIVVDFGTSTNFDVVSAAGEFVGGVIGPGIQVAAASLVSRTARLPRVELLAPASVIGKNTVECIQSALIYGTADMVDGIVARISSELGASPTIVATGGLAPLVIPHCRSVEHHEPWLTLEGLLLVHEKNAEPSDG